MTDQRPIPVGQYRVLQDFECPTASVRVFRLGGPMESIDQHVHRRSMQIYVSVAGRARITVDGVEHVLEPYDAFAVWAGTPHGAAPFDGEATIMNISVPPLEADDQLPVTPLAEPADMRIPGAGTDLED